MPKYEFGDEENKSYEIIPAGDYIVKVKSAEFTISKGKNTGGSDQIEFELEPEGYPGCAIRDTLIFHPSCSWKIDVAVKSLNLLIGGRPPQKGQVIDYTQEMLVGLRGWVTVKVEDYEVTKNNVKEKRQSNKIAVWITSKEKLSKAPQIEQPTDETPNWDVA